LQRPRAVAEHREVLSVGELVAADQLVPLSVADEVQQQGTVDHTPVYIREIVRRALELSATGVVLVHNHPSGDPTPSRPDIAMTREIVAAAKPLGITVHDHLIVGRHGHTSLKAEGLM